MRRLEVGENAGSSSQRPAISARRGVRPLHRRLSGAGVAVAVGRGRNSLRRRLRSSIRSSRSSPARFATGQSPFWTPNIFAGWPQIADPQSLIFSPLHVIVALLDAEPKPAAVRRAGVRAALRRRRRRDPVFPRPRLARRRRAGRRRWHFRSAARPRRASSMSGRSKAWCSCRWRCGCWRARSSARRGSRARGAGVFAALIVLGPRSGVADRGLCAGRALCCGIGSTGRIGARGSPRA